MCAEGPSPRSFKVLSMSRRMDASWVNKVPACGCWRSSCRLFCRCGISPRPTLRCNWPHPAGRKVYTAHCPKLPRSATWTPRSREHLTIASRPLLAAPPSVRHGQRVPHRPRHLLGQLGRHPGALGFPLSGLRAVVRRRAHPGLDIGQAGPHHGGMALPAQRHRRLRRPRRRPVAASPSSWSTGTPT